MGMGYERSKLWKHCFAPRKNDESHEERAWLRVELQRARERAALVAAEIARYLPAYTQHDVTHLDALWEMADLIIGTETILTPTEGYALGMAFLLHDLGMGASARIGGLVSLQQSPIWIDAAMLERRTAGLSDGAPLGQEAQSRINEFVLRRTHAEHAKQLGTQEWRDDSGNSYHIIDDADLRSVFGELVGELAYSHWWTVDDVARRYRGPALGAPAQFCASWTINRFRVAALMRCADAAHIDARRAPTFLRLIRGLQGYSRLHWVFQERLHRPTVEEDRLRYSSGRGLAERDADAWWIAFDTVNMINDELSTVDNYLRTVPAERFAARGVVGAHNTQVFSTCLMPSGWKPVDARPHIEDVPKIIASLGGLQLYGHNVFAPLRELLQNSIDATRAVESIAGEEAPRRVVRIVLSHEQPARLTVSDEGVGMSERGIVGALLNFGNSFWRSPEFTNEYAGLQRQKFRPAGRYGIGFFSVFILGASVKVATRRFDLGSDQALVLEFADGLNERPLLREAKVGDPNRLSGGTSIDVVLNKDSLDKLNGSPNLYGVRGLSFLDRVSHVARWAAAPIVATDGESTRSISSGKDLSEFNDEEFLANCCVLSSEFERKVCAKFMSNIREILDDDGAVVCRGALSPIDNDHSYTGSMIDEAGMNLGDVVGFLGACRVFPTRATRDSFKSVAPAEAVMAWAKNQLILLQGCPEGHSVWDQVKLSSNLADFGLYCRNFALCTINDEYHSYDEIVEWANEYEFAIIVDEEYLMQSYRDDDEARLETNVIVVKSSRASVASALMTRDEADALLRGSSIKGLSDVVAAALKEAWPNAAVEEYSVQSRRRVIVGDRSTSQLPVYVDSASVIRRHDHVSVESVFVGY